MTPHPYLVRERQQRIPATRRLHPIAEPRLATWSTRALLVVVVLLPWDFEWLVISLDVGAVRLMDVVTAATAAILLPRRSPGPPTLVLAGLAAALAACVLLSVARSDSAVLSSVATVRLLIGLTIVFAVGRRAMTMVPALGLAMAASGTIAAIAGGIFVLFGAGPFDDELFGAVTRIGPFDRLTRPFPHANTAAAYLAATSSITLALSLRTVGRTRVGLAAAATLQSAALIMTMSRVGLAALILGATIAIATATSSPREAMRIGLAVAAVLAVLGGTIVYAWEPLRFRSFSDTRSEVTGVVIHAADDISISGSSAVEVELTNTSNRAWSSTRAPIVRLAGRVKDDQNQGLIFDDLRWALPMDLEPGTTTRLAVEVPAQVAPGTYEIVWDLEFEGGGFISTWGGTGATSRLTVIESAGTELPGRLAVAAVSRTEIWRAAVDAIGERPVLGYGPGAFPVAWTVSRSPVPPPVLHAHNILLEGLIWWGLIGAIPFWLLVGGPVWSLSRRGSPKTWVLAGLASLLTAGLADWILVATSTSYLFWIVVGAAWALLAHEPPNGHTKWPEIAFAHSPSDWQPEVGIDMPSKNGAIADREKRGGT